MNQKLYNPKFKEKKTAAEKKKKTRNIVIIAVILVLASVATYWMMPRTGSLEDSTLFDEATVKSQAEKVIGYINADDYESLQDVKMKEIMTEERLSEAKEKVSDDWGAFKSMGDISTTTISKRGVNAAVAYVTATYENVEIHYTLAFDEDMKLTFYCIPKDEACIFWNAIESVIK